MTTGPDDDAELEDEAELTQPAIIAVAAPTDVRQIMSRRVRRPVLITPVLLRRFQNRDNRVMVPAPGEIERGKAFDIARGAVGAVL